MRISDWRSDVCSSDLAPNARLSVSAARDALNGSEASSRTPSFYQMQIYETYALPFASFVMLLLGLPSAFTHSRDKGAARSEEHTSELQSLMRISYAVFCLKNKNKT